MQINGVEVVPVAGSLEARSEQAPAIYPVKFWTEYKNGPDPLNPIPEDWVRWAKRGGGAFECNEKIARIRKDRAKWAVIQPYYDHWKTGQEAPVKGVPLDKLPGMTSEMVERFKLLHLRSIEDAAQMTEGDLEKIGLGARDIRERAKAYLERMPREQTNEDVADLKRQLAELQAMLAGGEPPKRRGRPPKTEHQPEAV